MAGTGTATQDRNDDLVALLTPDFQTRYESNFAWKSAISLYLALPGLRGFWPMSSVAYTNPQGLDLSANGLHLTNNNTSLFGYTNLVPHVIFDGINQYLSIADGGAGSALDIIGTESYINTTERGLTAYAWARFDAVATADEYILSKWIAGTNQRAYRLYRLSTGELVGSVSTDGIAIFNCLSTDTLADSTWYFTAMQYDPSTELSVWINKDKTTNAVAVPATIFDSTSAFCIGATASPASYMDGKQSLVAICASLHSDAMIKAVFQQTRALFNV